MVCHFTDIINDVINDVIRPLLLSPVPSPPQSFINAVNSVLRDIQAVLNGRHVDLKVSIANYFSAVSLHYFDEAIDKAIKSIPFLRFIRIRDSQKQCGARVLFNHIYTNTESAGQLIDLLQNISVAVGIIKQVAKIISVCI